MICLSVWHLNVACDHIAGTKKLGGKRRRGIVTDSDCEGSDNSPIKKQKASHVLVKRAVKKRNGTGCARR